MRFAGKTVIVTGAAKGLGKSTVLQFANEGAKVALFDIDQEGMEEVATTIREAGGEALVFVVDILKKETVKTAVAEVQKQFGKIDILINNAGVGWKSGVQPFIETPESDWEWILDLNVKGTLYMTQAVLEGMIERKYGKIINITSVASTCGLPKFAAYCASKGAIVAFTKSLAMEVGEHNINVNCVSPGLVSHEKVAPPSNGTFLGRWGTADEMATLIAYLASDDASFITGVDYLIDGGRTLGPKGL